MPTQYPAMQRSTPPLMPLSDPVQQSEFATHASSTLAHPSVPFTGVVDGKSKPTLLHSVGPVGTQWAAPASAPATLPGVAHRVAVYLLGTA